MTPVTFHHAFHCLKFIISTILAIIIFIFAANARREGIRHVRCSAYQWIFLDMRFTAMPESTSLMPGRQFLYIIFAGRFCTRGIVITSLLRYNIISLPVSDIVFQQRCWITITHACRYNEPRIEYAHSRALPLSAAYYAYVKLINFGKCFRDSITSNYSSPALWKSCFLRWIGNYGLLFECRRTSHHAFSRDILVGRYILFLQKFRRFQRVAYEDGRTGHFGRNAAVIRLIHRLWIIGYTP